MFTKRGVLYVNMNCDLKCHICYYKYSEDKRLTSLEDCYMQINRMRYAYGNDAVDITGGEPTINPYLDKIIKYCVMRGIKPRIITHGLHLTADYCKKLEDVGLDSYLISIHGSNSCHDAVVDREGAFKSLINNIKNCNRPIMINTVINKKSVDSLVELANYLKDQKWFHVQNIINFNPFHQWTKEQSEPLTVKYSDSAPILKKIVDIYQKSGHWINVRYYPYCHMVGYEKHVCGFNQVPYDAHEWDYASMFNSVPELEGGKIMELRDKETMMVKAKNPSSDEIYFRYAWGVDAKQVFYTFKADCCVESTRTKDECCKKCIYYHICDGFDKKYAELYGTDEMKPVEGDYVMEPYHFRKKDVFKYSTI